MTSLKAARAAEQAKALDALRQTFPAGSTVYLVSRKVSESSRQWSILAARSTADAEEAANMAEVENVSYLVSRAGIFPATRSDAYHAVTVRGTSDPHHVVYTLSRLIHGGTVAILGTVVL